MTEKPQYIVATIKPWNIAMYNKVIQHYPGNWHLVTEKKQLNLDWIRNINPEFIFFPHWSWIVPKEILEFAPCICFHATDLPYGRGGSPIQNLIAKGHKETMITALKMTDELDAGDVYFKEPLSLLGGGEEIFMRIAQKVSMMINRMISEPLDPKPQEGEITIFARRKPEQSRITDEFDSLEKLFDLIRMMDTDNYPRAFFENKHFRFEFSSPTLRTEEIEVRVKIKPHTSK